MGGLRRGRRGEDWRVLKKQNWLQALEGKSHMLRLSGRGSAVDSLPGTRKAPGSIPPNRKKEITPQEKKKCEVR